MREPGGEKAFEAKGVAYVKNPAKGGLARTAVCGCQCQGGRVRVDSEYPRATFSVLPIAWLDTEAHILITWLDVRRLDHTSAVALGQSFRGQPCQCGQTADILLWVYWGSQTV